MKTRVIKKIVCICLALAMVIGLLPTIAFASSDDYYLEVVVDNAPIRTGKSADAEIITRCNNGKVLVSSGSSWNWKFHKWYTVNVGGQTGYIYSGNVTAHSHSFWHITVNGITYYICDCGKVTADTYDRQSKEESTKVMNAAALAIPLTIADGPLPIGDILAVTITVVALCLADEYAIPTAEELERLFTETDFEDYLRERKENTCQYGSFRRVQRYPGGLKYLDHYCMDRFEAYLYVIICGDVYTEDENQALLLAAMHDSAIMERDKPSPPKDVSTYFYHFHLGTNRDIGGHVFFGLNDLGQGPSW